MNKDKYPRIILITTYVPATAAKGPYEPVEESLLPHGG